MTSFAFIFGVLPLAIATGAGANGRIAIGTAVIGGMLTATILAVFYIPFFFVLVRRGVRDGLKVVRRPHPAPAAKRRHEARGSPPCASLATAARRWSRSMCGPDPAIPASWPVGDPYLAQAEVGLPVLSYKQVFQDPRLQTLIARGARQQPQLDGCRANIAAAREQYHISSAPQLLPTVNAGAGANRLWQRQRATSAAQYNAGT